MVLISHRGNINQVIIEQENTLPYIQEAINRGYDVEIDCWYVDSILWLGHDAPEHEVSLEWLLERSSSLWIHCKNLEALSHLVNTDLRVFYHEQEAYTLVSDHHIWAHSLDSVDETCIIPLLNKDVIEKSFGVLFILSP